MAQRTDIRNGRKFRLGTRITVDDLRENEAPVVRRSGTIAKVFESTTILCIAVTERITSNRG